MIDLMFILLSGGFVIASTVAGHQRVPYIPDEPEPAEPVLIEHVGVGDDDETTEWLAAIWEPEEFSDDWWALQYTELDIRLGVILREFRDRLSARLDAEWAELIRQKQDFIEEEVRKHQHEVDCMVYPDGD